MLHTVKQTLHTLMLIAAGGAIFSLLLAVQISKAEQASDTVEIPAVVFSKIGGR